MTGSWMDVVKKYTDVFVVERYYDSEVGVVIGAFLSLDDAQMFSDQAVVTCRTPHEVEISRCAPTPCETWRRLAHDRRWSTDVWERRVISACLEDRP